MTQRIQPNRRGDFVVEMHEVGVERRGTSVLDGVSWQVKPGEHWVIIGANGSGKTSLLHVLLSYLPATRGAFSVLGHRHGSFDWRILRRSIGVVSPALPDMMAPTEPGINVVYSGKAGQIGHYGGVDADAVERASQLLRETGAEYLEQRRWQVLSQGERQRLLIARALMAEPNLLILDEPCSGLDPAAREGFLEFLVRVQERPDSPCVVLVTHHVEEITPRFSHVLVMKRGRVLARGTKTEILTSETMTDAFEREATMRLADGRYRLSFASSPETIV